MAERAYIPYGPVERVLPYAAYAARHIVCDFYGIELAELIGPDRFKPIPEARSLLAKTLHEMIRPRPITFTEISAIMGGRDHSTSMYHAKQGWDKKLAADAQLMRTLIRVQAEIAKHECQTCRDASKWAIPVARVGKSRRQPLAGSPLTELEWTAARLYIIKEKTLAQLSAELGIDGGETIGNIYEKTGLKSKIGLAVYYVRNREVCPKCQKVR